MSNRTLLVSALLALVPMLTVLGPADAATIDDFETYIDTVDLQTMWDFTAELDTTTPNPGSGTQSLRSQDFTDSGESIMTRTSFSPALDLTSASGISLWVRRISGSVDAVQVSMTIRDFLIFPCRTMNPPTITGFEWQKIELDLDDCGGLILSDIIELSITATNETDGPGAVMVSYDDIEVNFDLFDDGFESGNASSWSVIVD